MHDQASRLRKMFDSEKTKTEKENYNSASRVIAVASGKGGVGKTNVSVNLGVSLQKMDKEVLLLDADMGMANVDVLIGVTPRYNLGHVLEDKCDIEDALITGPEGLTILPGSSGIDEFINMNIYKIKQLLKLASHLEENYDIIIIDVGAGAHQGVVNFIKAADEVIVVLTPEPTAIMDAYSLIKILSKNEVRPKLNLIVNQVDNDREGDEVSKRISSVIKDYLDLEISITSYIPYDNTLREAVKKQKPIVNLYPRSRAGKAFTKSAGQLIDRDVGNNAGMQGFVNKVLGFFKS
ncbi:MinD/ParA family protein [Halanaerobiaceae bacterium Z-7014]|uniref:MinD/ParA family protein n=1 Tax=Halonatronomonas betaini TaxID=2778430 RepID=A0A931F8T6_9FIRM|nr:MinD/ParA family protein [Halonatronomonas betaini]MBF8435704.1 MinD/ParA family protein [Halonatronomonas betaini]